MKRKIVASKEKSQKFVRLKKCLIRLADYIPYMELDVCIIGRRSIRRYEDKAVPKEVIDKLLEAGVWAPSGMNAQPWRFVVIEN